MTRSFRLGPTVALVLASTLSTLLALSSELDAAPPALDRPTFDASGLEPTPPEPSWSETFETPGVSWRYLYQEGEVEILEHRRVDDFAFSGKRSERLRYEAKKPGVVVFGHYCDYPAFYNETAPSVCVRSDRPGVSLAALVVFPKTLRPDTKTPMTALLPGSTYTKTGEWERLVFPRDFQGLLDETTRALRGEHRIPVDADGAYIRQLVLITEARRGTYSLWIDDLEIVEHIPSNRDGLRLSERGARFNPTNLLSCRLRLTETPIFWRADDANDSSVYGEEPFAIDRKQAEKNERVPLEFVRDAVAPPSPAPETPRSTRPKASYEDALAVLPSLSPEPFATTSADALFAAAPRSGDSVGQVAFAADAPTNGARVASADYAADPTLGVEPPVESPTDELVSGSGTLADPFAAATEDFVRPGERLVANARFGSGGRLETENGRVYALRAVESQNEPFAFLKKLGFNAVVLPAPPTAAQLKEANDAKIWLIAPAPIGSETVSKVDFDAKTPPSEAETRSAANPQPATAAQAVPTTLPEPPRPTPTIPFSFGEWAPSLAPKSPRSAVKPKKFVCSTPANARSSAPSSTDSTNTRKTAASTRSFSTGVRCKRRSTSTLTAIGSSTANITRRTRASFFGAKFKRNRPSARRGSVKRSASSKSRPPSFRSSKCGNRRVSRRAPAAVVSFSRLVPDSTRKIERRSTAPPPSNC